MANPAQLAALHDAKSATLTPWDIQGLYEGVRLSRYMVALMLLNGYARHRGVWPETQFFIDHDKPARRNLVLVAHRIYRAGKWYWTDAIICELRDEQGSLVLRKRIPARATAEDVLGSVLDFLREVERLKEATRA